jgi:hypothetical protein
MYVQAFVLRTQRAGVATYDVYNGCILCPYDTYARIIIGTFPRKVCFIQVHIVLQQFKCFFQYGKPTQLIYSYNQLSTSMSTMINHQKVYIPHIFYDESPLTNNLHEQFCTNNLV